MLQKIREYYKSKLENHPKKTFRIILAFCVIISILLNQLPDQVETIIIFALQIVIIIYIVTIDYKAKKAKKSIEHEINTMLKRKWRRYIDCVEDTFKSKKEMQNLNVNWLKIFDELVRDTAMQKWGLDEEYVNDFDLASCLIFTLTWNSLEDSNIIHALECTKYLICNPKAYIYNLSIENGIKLKLKEHLPTVEISLIDTICFSNETIVAVRRCLKNRNTEGVEMLSNFLYELYLKCE